MCKCGFCNVCVCVCVCVCKCGFFNVWVCVCVGFVMCVLVFTVFFYCSFMYIYEYSYLLLV